MYLLTILQVQLFSSSKKKNGENSISIIICTTDMNDPAKPQRLLGCYLYRAISISRNFLWSTSGTFPSPWDDAAACSALRSSFLLKLDNRQLKKSTDYLGRFSAFKRAPVFDPSREKDLSWGSDTGTSPSLSHPNPNQRSGSLKTCQH